MARITCNFLSYTLHRAVDLTVIVPTMCFPEMMEEDPHHPQEAAYPVLYLLHGYGNNHATWNGYTSVELYAEERNLCVVMLSAENMAYVDHGGDNDYFRFISQELPEFVQCMFPVSRRPEDTFIAGLSMGGYGALIHGLRDSEKFAAIGSFSGAPHSKRVNCTGNENDTFLQLKQRAEKAKKVPMYISCGDEDFLLEDNIEFKDAAIALGYQVTWVVGKGFTHEWRFWDQQVEAFMDWIPRTDPYYNGGKKRKI